MGDTKNSRCLGVHRMTAFSETMSGFNKMSCILWT